MAFCDRLKYLRKKSKLTQQQIADTLGIKRSTYARYETGDHEPDYRTLCQIANHFHVSTDFLIRKTIEKGLESSISIEQEKYFVLYSEEEKLLNELIRRNKFRSFIIELANAPDNEIKKLATIWDVIKSN